MSLTITPRTLWVHTSTEGVLNTTTLEDVRKHLSRLAAVQMPTDFTRPLSDLQVRFEGKKMLCRWADSPSDMLVLDHGAQQMATQVLPSRFFPGLKNLALFDAEGEKIATEAWMKFARRQGKKVRVRTIRAMINKEVRLLVRSCLSTDYALYSNLEFVDDILNHASEYARLPVLDWCITDTGMRIRFVGMDAVTSAFAPMDKSILDNAAIPMIELWNSEVGLRRVGIHGGLWRLRSATGVGFWEKEADNSWVHRGSTNRIRNELTKAFERTRIIAQDVVKAYEEAAEIEIDDIFAWTKKACEPHLTQGQIEEVIKNLTHPLVSPNGTLATVVDAIGLMARKRAPVATGTVLPKDHPEPDLYEQSEIEYVAAAVLHKGRQLASKGNGRIAA